MLENMSNLYTCTLTQYTYTHNIILNVDCYKIYILPCGYVFSIQNQSKFLFDNRTDVMCENVMFFIVVIYITHREPTVPPTQLRAETEPEREREGKSSFYNVNRNNFAYVEIIQMGYCNEIKWNLHIIMMNSSRKLKICFIESYREWLCWINCELMCERRHKRDWH